MSLARKEIYYWAPQRQAIHVWMDLFGAKWRSRPIFNDLEIAGISRGLIFEMVTHVHVVPDDVRRVADAHGWTWIKIDDSALRALAAKAA